MEASMTSTASASRGLPKFGINGYSPSGGFLRRSRTSRNCLAAFQPPGLSLSPSLRLHSRAKANISDRRNQAKPFLFLSHLVASVETVEKSYIMIKPDGVQRGLVGDIISRFERKGFVLKGLKLFQCPTELAEEHYKDLKSKPFFPKLVKYITSGPVVCMAWEGPGVVASARKLIGITNPLQAEPGTIRGDFAIQTGRNVVHGSDSLENGEREIGHVYAVVAPKNNEEETEYWLARCVETKHKLTAPREDDDGFPYPTGSVVVVGTWLRKYLIRKNGLPAFEDYETHKKIIHYSHLVLATNIKLERYRGKPTNKELWNISMEDHETIIDALEKREDGDGTME